MHDVGGDQRPTSPHCAKAVVLWPEGPDGHQPLPDRLGAQSHGEELVVILSVGQEQTGQTWRGPSEQAA